MIWNFDELEDVACDFCGNSMTNYVFTRSDGLNIVECNNCELCFISPRPKEDLIFKLYNDYYFKKTRKTRKEYNYGFVDYFNYFNRKILLHKSIHIINLIKNFTNISFKRCLEIGCATGEFCQVLNKTGSYVVGIDLSKDAIKEAIRRYPNCDFRLCRFDELPENEYFDAIFAFEVIEHIPKPMEFFKKIKKHLNDNGIFVLSTPNYDCGKKVGLTRWVGFHMSFEHIFFFNAKTLRDYGSSVGLKIIQYFTGGGDGIMLKGRSDNMLRFFIKCILDVMHLLEFSRKIKQMILKPKYEFDYQVNGCAHNLLLVFKSEK